MTDYGLKLAALPPKVLLIKSPTHLTSAGRQKSQGKVSRNNTAYKNHVFWADIKLETDKVTTVTTVIRRIMPHTSYPKPSKSRLLMSVSHSIVIYSAEIWATLEIQKT